MDYQPCPFRKVYRGPRYVLEGSIWLFHVGHFWREIGSSLRNLRVLSPQPVLEDPSRLYRKSPSCCQVSSSIWLLLDGGIIVGSSWSCGSLLIKGIQMLWRDCFMLVSGVTGSLLPLFYSRQTSMNKFSWGDLPLSLTGFIFCCCFLLLFRGGEVNIEVNKKMRIDLFFQFLVT